MTWSLSAPQQSQVSGTLVFLLSLLPSCFAGSFESWVLNRPAREAQSDPGALSRTTSRFWRAIALKVGAEAGSRRSEALRILREEAKKLPEPLDIPDEDEATLSTGATYGTLPEVRVDQGHGAIFPKPIAKPERFSWYQLASDAGHALRTVRKLERTLSRWLELPPGRRARQFDPTWQLIVQANAELASLALRSRYLDTWIPQLERQWELSRAEGREPLSHLLARALQSNDEGLVNILREALRPRRVMRRSFLPEELPRGGTVVLPIATDIPSRRFLAEVEGALDTHWNQSDWARSRGVRFKIRWRAIPKDADFSRGKRGLDEHLARFPEDQAAMTTGGLTTFVRGRALVLGPGRIQPRTLAHELGHLMGFGDCYLRTLSGQGLFGLGVLEWDNPLYPDELMCDDSVGVPRAAAW